MYPANTAQYTAQVVKLIMIHTGTYDDMPMRSFVGNLNGDLLQQFQHVTNGGELISSQSLAPLAGQILMPEASPSGLAQIQNGFATTRIRFLLELLFTSPQGHQTSQYLTGYTDHPGVTRIAGTVDRVAFDPQMCLFFNNIITVNRGNFNGQPFPKLWEASQLVFQTASPKNFGFTQPSGPQQYLMTPEEVINRIGVTFYGAPSVQIHDLRPKLDLQGMAKSKRSNCLPSNYLSKAVGELHNQKLSNPDDQFFVMASPAASNIQEMPIYADKALSLLNELSFKTRGFITYGELCSICPETDNMAGFVDKTISQTQVLAAQQTQNAAHANFLLHGAERGYAAPLTGSNEEAIVATMITQAVPAIMADLMLTTISFSATNLGYVGNDFGITIHGFQTFLTDVDVTPQLQQFTYRLKQEILVAVTFNGQKPIKLDATVDILGDTFIGIQMHGYQYDYQVPSFCDALLTPIVTGNLLQLDNVASTINGLVQAI